MKVAFLMLKNDRLKGKDNKQIMEGLKQVVEESFEWWHDNLGMQDSLELGEWKIEKIVVADESDIKKVKQTEF